MNKILFSTLLTLAAIDAYAGWQPQERTPDQSYLVIIDTSPRTAWNGSTKVDFFPTDAELKDPDQYGEPEYWFSTVSGSREIDYQYSSVRDVNAKAWFTLSYDENFDNNFFHRWEWIPSLGPEYYDSNYSQIRAMLQGSSGLATTPNFEVNSIAIQPDLSGTTQYGGKSISSIWDSTLDHFKPSYVLFNESGPEMNRQGRMKFRIAPYIIRNTAIKDTVNKMVRNFNFTPWNASTGTPTNWTKGTLVSTSSQASGGGITLKVTNPTSTNYNQALTTQLYNLEPGKTYTVLLSCYMMRDATTDNYGYSYVRMGWSGYTAWIYYRDLSKTSYTRIDRMFKVYANSSTSSFYISTSNYNVSIRNLTITILNAK